LAAAKRLEAEELERAERLVGKTAAQTIASVDEILEQLCHARVVDRAAFAVAEQVLLADLGDVGGMVFFREQVVKRLLALRTDVLGNRLVPFLAVGEDRIDVEHHPAEVEHAVLDDIADAEPGLAVTGSFDAATSLRRIELRTIHGRI
jgi:hypothetical protein